MPTFFDYAKPIWAAGERPDKLDTLGFRCIFHAKAPAQGLLRIAASSMYRAWLNGKFLAYGPARCAEGHFRVDRIDLTPLLQNGANLLAIEVVHYGVNSFSNIDQAPFAQAEIVLDSRVVASTGSEGGGFELCNVPGRLRRVQRFSYMRPFSEAYRLSPSFDRWRKLLAARGANIPAEIRPEVHLHDRGAPYPNYESRQPIAMVGDSGFTVGPLPDELHRDRSLLNVGKDLKGFKESELEVKPSLDYLGLKFGPTAPAAGPELDQGRARTHDLGTNLTGFIACRIACVKPTKLYLAFDEILTDGRPDPHRMSCVNIIQIELEAGEYSFESAEAYTLRYLQAIVLAGAATITDIGFRAVANPEGTETRFACSDSRLNRIFAAAVETLRQNSVDFFTDCPTRERAGYLCDSFFTARSAFTFYGNAKVERDFLQNFALPERFHDIPEGLMPMCYPSDTLGSTYIPQWPMWLVVQLHDYLLRTGDRVVVDGLKSRIIALLGFLAKHENSDGLLERLPGWNFVEWSKANDWVQDVSYPTNMLYANVLRSAGALYGLERENLKSENVRHAILNQSFDGSFFVDNAVLKGTNPHPTTNRSEVCQYSAFFHGVADKAVHGELWDTLRKDFGPDRSKTGKFPEVAAANTFIGDYLRLELLSEAGADQQVVDEIVGYFLKMADTTGTLWENEGSYASCNHGFASYALVLLMRHGLGISRIDQIERRLVTRRPDNGCDWAEGSFPVAHGVVSLKWDKNGPPMQASAPRGYLVS